MQQPETRRDHWSNSAGSGHQLEPQQGSGGSVPTGMSMEWLANHPQHEWPRSPDSGKLLSSVQPQQPQPAPEQEQPALQLEPAEYSVPPSAFSAATGPEYLFS